MVAISTAAAKAQTSPATSRAWGSRRPMRQVASITKTTLELCITVAVPALVKPTATM